MNFENNLLLKLSINKTSNSKNEFPSAFPKNEALSKDFQYKENLFKVKTFHSRKAKSFDHTYNQMETKDSFKKFTFKKTDENGILIPKPNKNNLQYIENLKKKIGNEVSFINKPTKKENFISLLQKEKIMKIQKYLKDKESLRIMLKIEKRRTNIITEEENAFMDSIQKMNSRFKSIDLNASNGTFHDPNKLLSYMEFQNAVKDKDYLLGKNKRDIELQVFQAYQEYNEKKGRRRFEWRLF